MSRTLDTSQAHLDPEELARERVLGPPSGGIPSVHPTRQPSTRPAPPAPGRRVSALLEAARYGASEALMLVHSFDATDASFGDYRAFATALGLSGAEPSGITSPVVLARVDAPPRLGQGALKDHVARSAVRDPPKDRIGVACQVRRRLADPQSSCSSPPTVDSSSRPPTSRTTWPACTLSAEDRRIALGLRGRSRRHGARMIVAAVRAGRRVALTAQSHAAAQNMLRLVEHCAHREGVALRGVNKARAT